MTVRDKVDANIGKSEIPKMKNLRFKQLELIIEEPFLEELVSAVKEISDSSMSVTLKVLSDPNFSNQPISSAVAIFAHCSNLDIRLVDLFSIS